MAGLVVVAIPSEDDYVWKISSEKAPHLTLLYLGEDGLGAQTEHATQFIEHAVATTLSRFGLSVDRRGTLGPDEADVVFFEKTFTKDLERFRSYLLADKDIAQAYHSAPQFPTWTPHLTLGYPETPAKSDDRDYPGIHWVNFDRIALWTGDSEGPTFELKSNDNALEVGMSHVQQGAAAMQGILSHHGVKGMKWGIRRDRSGSSGPTPVSTKQKGKRLQTKGGKGHAPTEDATRAAVGRQKAKSSGTHALTNQELREVVNRMNLEQQYSKLAASEGGAKIPGGKFAADILVGVGKTQATRLANDAVAAQLGKVLKTAANTK